MDAIFMPIKDPTNWSYTTWLLAISMASSGGIINWISRIKQGKTRAFNIIELIGEVFTSGFVGVGVFMVLESIGQPIGLCAAAAGIGGHMATRLLFLIERLIEGKFKRIE
jgi:hypothetical protein